MYYAFGRGCYVYRRPGRCLNGAASVSRETSLFAGFYFRNNRDNYSHNSQHRSQLTDPLRCCLRSARNVMDDPWRIRFRPWNHDRGQIRFCARFIF